MPQKRGANGEMFKMSRGLQELQLKTYLKIVARKHNMPPDVSETDVSKMSDDDLTLAISIYRDLAHLPPE